MALFGRNKPGAKIIGVDKVLKGLDREIKKLERKSESGLYKGALYIKAEAVKITPWKTGNLAGSAYIYPPYPAKIVEIGYTASYAVYVHEVKFKNYSKEGTSWKFLERPLKENKKLLLEYIRRG